MLATLQGWDRESEAVVTRLAAGGGEPETYIKYDSDLDPSSAISLKTAFSAAIMALMYLN